MSRGPLQVGFLFDTQTLILWAKGQISRKIISRIHDDSRILVSVVSLWEFLLKSRFSNVGLSFTDLLQLIESLQADLLAIKVTHLARLQALPLVKDHRDPFDRLLISQALDEGLTLVGGDCRFPEYSKAPGCSKLKVLWH